VNHELNARQLRLAAPGPARRRRRGGPAARYRASLYLMLAPFLAGTLALVVVPAALSFGLAFTAYDGLSPPEWRGLANFRGLLHDQLFLTAARNSLVFVALGVPLRALAALALALLLNRPRRGVGLYRAAVYLPTIVPSPAYALAWLWVFNPVAGPLNALLGALGLPAPAWLADSRTALLAMVIMSLFQLGEGLVVLLAGLQATPRAYYDAAAIDGAGAWGALRHITLPLLAPWLLLLIIRDIIVSAQSTFAPALLMTGGGPYYATLVLPLLMYQTAFDRFRFGEGAAIMLLVFAGVAALIALSYLLLGGWGYEDEV
jgi:multiple sugar transport system permease protein